MIATDEPGRGTTGSGQRHTGRSRARLAIAISTLPWVVGGCITVGIGGGGKPLPSLITLTPTAQAPAGLSLSSNSADPLVVLALQADRTLETTRIPVQVGDSAVAYLTGAAWADQPAHLFRGLLVETIRARGKRLVLDDNLPQGLIHVSGRLDSMGFDARTHAVTVRFDALRVGRNGVTTSRRFEAVEQDIPPLPADVAPALNRAANDVAGQVADWVDQ